MTNKTIFSILMVLFVSTIAFSQIHVPTIYTPANGSVVEVVSNTNNVQVVFDDYGNGGTPMKHYYFDVYVDNIFSEQVTKSPFSLILTAGTHTVNILLRYRTNMTDPFRTWDDDYSTFTVVKVPTISISANAT